MSDLTLPIFDRWADQRIRLKHDWFANLPGWVLSGSREDLDWNNMYPEFRDWLRDATIALSPAQVLDLALFDAWPKEFREASRQSIQRIFEEHRPIWVDAVEWVLGELKVIDRRLRPDLGVQANTHIRQELSSRFARCLAELAHLPSLPAWPEIPPVQLPLVLVIDDVLGRLDLPEQQGFSLTEENRRALERRRKLFCEQFRLTEGVKSTAAGAKPGIAIVRFSAGQTWDANLGLVNDLNSVEASIASAEWALVLVDLRFSGLDADEGKARRELFGLRILQKLRDKYPNVPAIALSNESEPEALDAVTKLGFEYLHKTSTSSDLLYRLSFSPRVSPEHLRKALQIPDDIVGRSKRFLAAFVDAESAARDPREPTVLILGETGTGKEGLARYIHHQSQRAASAVVARDCGRLDDALAESDLFGHCEGAFTGASHDKPGDFHNADGSTLFLDEFAQLTPRVFAKLLRVLEPEPGADGTPLIRNTIRMIQPVGWSQRAKIKTTVDVRLILGTNSSMEDLSKAKHDVAERIPIIVRLPPLRERGDDIVEIAQFMLSPGLTLSKDAEQYLLAQDLPGNARELRRILEGAARGKGRFNVIRGADLAAAHPNARRQFGHEAPTNAESPVEKVSGRSSTADDDPGPPAPPDEWAGVVTAVNCLLSTRDWKKLTQGTADEIDSALSGRVPYVIAKLVEWVLWRQGNVSRAMNYLLKVNHPINNSTAQRAVEQFLDCPDVAAALAKSPYLADNVPIQRALQKGQERGEQWRKTLVKKDTSKRKRSATKSSPKNT